MSDLISRQAAIDALKNRWRKTRNYEGIGDDIAEECELYLKQLPSAQPDYTELKQEFIRMASYIDALLECSDEQKETLIGFISRLSEYMSWTERD